jgi:hypothetical protein
MPRPSKASRAAVRVQQNLKTRRIEQAAARFAAINDRTESIRISLFFINSIRADMILRDMERENIEVTRVFFDLVIDTHDVLSSEYIPLLTSCLELRVFAVKGNLRAFFALQYTGFYAFALLENEAMKAMSFTDKRAAIDAMWKEIKGGEFEDACRVFRDANKNNHNYYHVLSVDVRIQMSMESPWLFFDPPDGKLPIEVQKENKRVQDMRLIKAQDE